MSSCNARWLIEQLWLNNRIFVLHLKQFTLFIILNLVHSQEPDTVSCCRVLAIIARLNSLLQYCQPIVCSVTCPPVSETKRRCGMCLCLPFPCCVASFCVHLRGYISCLHFLLLALSLRQPKKVVDWIFMKFLEAGAIGILGCQLFLAM